MRGTAWFTSSLLLLALAREARAQQAPDEASASPPEVVFPRPRVSVFTRLTYERTPGAEICPGETKFHWALAARLGYDPFAANPKGISVGDVHVVLTKVPGGFVAQYAWTGSRDVMKAEGRQQGPGHTRRDCDDVLVQVAVDFSTYFTILELDYGEKYAPEPSRKPAPACPASSPEHPAPGLDSRFSVWPAEWPLPPLEKPKLEPPKPLERWPIALRFGAAVWTEFVAKGLGSLGLSAEIGARYRSVSVGFEVHGDPPLGSATFTNLGKVSFARVSGGLLLCGHFGWFTGCGVGEAGRFLFPNHVAELPPSAFYGAAGVRVGLDFPVLPPRLFLGTALQLLAPISPANFLDKQKNTSVFASAGPSVGLGLGLLVELPP